MMKRRFSKIPPTLLVLGFVVACDSSSSTLTVKQASTEEIPPGKTVALSVESGFENPSVDHRRAIQSMRVALFRRLVSDQVFKQVVPAPGPADYSLDVKLRDANLASAAARAWFGVYAGTSNIILKVDLRDQTTGRLLTTFDVTGRSARFPDSMSTGVGDAIREATDKVVEALK